MELLFSLKYGYEGMSNPGRILLVILYLIIGLVLIIKGGDWFVDSASWIAEKFGIPKLIVGATIVSMATTLPELLVSVFAAIEGASAGGTASGVDMATGNAIGSVIANTGLIMAISILFMPVKVDRKSFLVKPLLLILSICLLWIFSIDRKFVWYEAIIMLIILVGFFVDNVIEARMQMKKEAIVKGTMPSKMDKTTSESFSSNTAVATNNENKSEAVKVETKANSKKDVWKNIVFFILGVVGIVVGAQLLVDNATELANEAGIPEKIISITIVAIGTSLPELITTITAIIKKQSDLSVGNVIGANVIDMTLILSVCSFIYGQSLPVYDSMMYLDLPFAFGIAVVAIVPTLFTKKLQRWQGFALLALYAAYLTLYIVFYS